MSETTGFDKVMTEAIGEAFNDLVENHGFVLPVMCIAVSRNGSVLVTRYYADGDAGAAAETIAEHYPDPRGFVTPIYVMWVDMGGIAERPALQGFVADGKDLKWVH